MIEIKDPKAITCSTGALLIFEDEDKLTITIGTSSPCEHKIEGVSDEREKNV